MPAIEECLEVVRHRPPKAIPLVLCLAERDRPGRFTDIDDSIIKDVETRLGFEFHPDSAWLAEGRIGGVKALAQRKHLYFERRACLRRRRCGHVARAETLNAYHEKRRIQTADNSDGFIPGEAGTAVARADHWRRPHGARRGSKAVRTSRQRRGKISATHRENIIRFKAGENYSLNAAKTITITAGDQINNQDNR